MHGSPEVCNIIDGVTVLLSHVRGYADLRVKDTAIQNENASNFARMHTLLVLWI